MGYLSAARRDDVPEAADTAKHMLIIVNERLLGDGLATPRLRFQQGFFERDISVEADDGWNFHTHYKAPWLREMIRKLTVGNMVDSCPVDFVERLIETVRFNRPHWLVEP